MTELEASALRFKIATEDWELEQVHQLNYQTFVDEIPQHPPTQERALIDRFHGENVYCIAVRDRQVLGMVALRGQRPFSLDRKLPDLDRYLPTGRQVCEVRLLATSSGSRNGVVFRGLIDLLVQHCLARGYDLAVISGTVRQARLYRHMGFVPFGPVVGTGAALYQPMYLTLESFRQRGRAFPALQDIRRSRAGSPLRFLPGPVTVHPDVEAAFQQPAVSHRSADFLEDFQATRRELCRWANAAHVQILMGSGTLANDAIAAQLTSWPGRGLILSNGAFGERLIDHAARFGLRFEVLRLPWGQPFDRHLIDTALDLSPSVRWVWAVHGETSTGTLNDLSLLKEAALSRGLRLCVDVVSSFGTVPVDLTGVALASGVSGKGLAAFCGLALVFHDVPLSSNPALPRYLDLGYYAEQDGIPFTVSSNLLYALEAAIERFEGERHFTRLRVLAAQLRAGLGELGLTPVTAAPTFPAVTTIAIAPPHSSLAIGRSLQEAGYLVNYRSAYLPPRGWLQICLMGVCTPLMIDELLGALRAAIRGQGSPDRLPGPALVAPCRGFPE